MPYASNDDLPKSVRGVLPDKARTIWRKTHNSMMSGGNDEEAAAKAAWAAVKKAGYRKDEGGMWKMLSQTDQGISLFLSDLTRYSVRHSKGENGNFLVEGLPILKPGVWNGVTFTEEHLEEIAANLARQREEEDYEPPLRPFHVSPGERVNVRDDLLGNITNAYVQDGTLLADAIVYDADTISRMQKGQYRYLSAEARINPGGVDGQTRLHGLAFVDDPAIKGMPWRLVMNREEFSFQAAEEPSEVTAPMKGGYKPMSIVDKMKQALGLLQEAAAEDVALRAVPPNEPGLAPPADTPEVVELRQRAEAAELKAKNAEESQATMLHANAKAQAKASAEALVHDRFITPAQTTRLEVVLLALHGQEHTVTLREDDQDVERVEALDATLVTLLREGQQISEAYFRQSAQNTPPGSAEGDLQVKAARIAAYARGESKDARGESKDKS